jgi:hypothetical protein
MKNLKQIFGLSVIALALGACSDEVSPQYNSDSLAVHFNAQVGNLISRSTTGTALSEGTAVNISTDGTNYYGYTSDANGNLTPTGSDFIRWSSSSATSIGIKAYTPVVDGATGTSFSLANYTDQSEGFANADFASFDGTVKRTTGSNAVGFELQRRMTQVKVKIASFDTKFTDTDEDTYTFDITVYSPSTSITVSDGTVTGSGSAIEVTPYGGEGMTTATTDPAVAIITPGAEATADFIAVQVKKNGTAVGSKLIASERPELLAGYSYTFNLTVKKDRINISSVQLTDWEDVSAIDGGAAAEYVIDLDLDKYTSSADVYADVKRLSDMGVKSLKFKGKISRFMGTDETIENTTALRDFFFDGTKTWLPIETINLSEVEDLTAIPANSFCYESTSSDDYLKEIIAPQVTTIGNAAFKYCEKLKRISAPKVESIGNYAFYSNPLTTIEFPAAITIGEYAFNGAKLTTVELPAAITIGKCAFSWCGSLTNMSLPKATTIGANAFSCCSNLSSVSMPNASTIGEYVFQNCNALSELSLPAATKIGEYAFFGSSLTKVSLPAATEIGRNAFQSCSSLTSVSMPAATTIGSSIFYECTTANIDLTLNKSQESCVSGTTWTYTYIQNNNSYSSKYTFKSITFAE